MAQCLPETVTSLHVSHVKAKGFCLWETVLSSRGKVVPKVRQLDDSSQGVRANAFDVLRVDLLGLLGH
jgi:hypothetical protein